MDIKKIAKECGVSIATVSRVLNNKPNVAEETRKKIIEVIKSYDFVPNRIAKSFVQKHTFTIGITPPDIHPHSSPDVFFFPVLIDGMEEILWKEKYNLLLLYAKSPEIQKRSYFVNLYRSKQVEGLILLNIKKDNQAFICLEESGYPCVTIGRVSENQKSSYVDTNNIKRTYMAVEHFITVHNFRKVAYIGIKPIYSVYADALEGYKLCMKRYGIPVEKDIVYLAKDEDEEEGYRGIKKILSESPECLVIMGNLIFNGILKYFGEKGIKIPEDMPIIHCSELPMVIPYEIKITQVKQPVFELGRYAIEILLRQIKGNKKREQVILNPEFCPGNSCGCSIIEGKR
ncbi:MAG: LacI family transcriptional regulator [Candidatus Omnitrophica bacterium]|nr:LacI family transcriptional regulator [Candidatus Omnitrophota bacterium]